LFCTTAVFVRHCTHTCAMLQVQQRLLLTHLRAMGKPQGYLRALPGDAPPVHCGRGRWHTLTTPHVDACTAGGLAPRCCVCWDHLPVLRACGTLMTPGAVVLWLREAKWCARLSAGCVWLVMYMCARSCEQVSGLQQSCVRALVCCWAAPCLSGLLLTRLTLLSVPYICVLV
jgi:hypothetical protein